MSRQIMPRRLFAVSLAMLLCPMSIRSQAAPARTVAQAPLPDRLAIDSGRAIMLRGMARAGTPGSSVTVMRAGKIVWSQGLGLADVENRVPVTTLTKFRIGSVSKSLTASAVGRLVESGKLDLAAPVQTYVPSCSSKAYPSTTRKVAGHLAGSRHYANADFLSPRHYNSVIESLSIFDK